MLLVLIMHVYVVGVQVYFISFCWTTSLHYCRIAIFLHNHYGFSKFSILLFFIMPEIPKVRRIRDLFSFCRKLHHRRMLLYSIQKIMSVFLGKWKKDWLMKKEFVNSKVTFLCLNMYYAGPLSHPKHVHSEIRIYLLANDYLLVLLEKLTRQVQ